MKKINLENYWFKIFIKWEFRTIYNIEKEFKINRNALYMRIKRLLESWVSHEIIQCGIELLIEDVKMKSNEKYMFQWKYRTIKEIAKILCLSPSALSRYINGLPFTSWWSVGKLLLILSICKVSIIVKTPNLLPVFYSW